MKLISLNINDFGGCLEHLNAYKKINRYGKEVIDWAFWQTLDKTKICQDLLEYVVKHDPEILILQEFEVNNSKEIETCFTLPMAKQGYLLLGNIPNFKASMTVLFIKKKLVYEKIDPGHLRNARAYGIKVNDYVIYGTHVPVVYDQFFWQEIISFYQRFKDEKVLLVGDFNTYLKGTATQQKYLELINCGAIDLWLKRGNANDMPTEKKYRGRLDYALVSPLLEKTGCTIEIDTSVMDELELSDHSAIIVEI